MDKRILLVDNDMEALEQIRSSLSAEGFSIRVASTGREAIRKAVYWTPDAVILNLVLPGMDGFTLCETLRKHPATAGTFIIGMSSVGGEMFRLAAIEHGADAYLRKPVNINQILGCIRQTAEYCPITPVVGVAEATAVAA